MKPFVCALLGLTPSLLAWEFASAQTTGDTHLRQRVLVRPNADNVQIFAQPTADGEPAKFEIVRVVDGDEADEHDVMLTADAGEIVVTADAAAKGDGRSDAKTKKIQVITRSKDDDPDAAQRGWLGVSIVTVPAAVAAQAGTQDRGVMIGNVMTGSPADKAGIQPNDLIVSINGEDVAGDVGPAVDLIKGRKPGETINVGILRDGQPSTVRVTLGSRADMKNFEWKFEGLPAEVEEQIKTRGKFIMKDPSGQVIVKDLGDLNNLGNLPDNIRMFVPQSGTRSTKVFVNKGQQSVNTHIEVNKDGSTVSIEQNDGGPITVRRTDQSGQETVATYDNEDALKAGDEDAYKLYSQTGQNVFVYSGDDDNAPHFFFHGDPSGQWRTHLEESLAQAKEAYGQAMQELHNNLAQLNQGGTFDVEKFHNLLGAHGQGFGGFSFNVGKPSHRFEVNADGSIEVSIRKGDSEMTQSFRNEADMANRRPDLYEKYQDVKAADED